MTGEYENLPWDPGDVAAGSHCRQEQHLKPEMLKVDT